MDGCGSPDIPLIGGDTGYTSRQIKCHATKAARARAIRSLQNLCSKQVPLSSKDEVSQRLLLTKAHMTGLVAGKAAPTRDRVIRNLAWHTQVPSFFLNIASARDAQLLQRGSSKCTHLCFIMWKLLAKANAVQPPCAPPSTSQLHYLQQVDPAVIAVTGSHPLPAQDSHRSDNTRYIVIEVPAVSLVATDDVSCAVSLPCGVFAESMFWQDCGEQCGAPIFHTEGGASTAGVVLDYLLEQDGQKDGEPKTSDRVHSHNTALLWAYFAEELLSNKSVNGCMGESETEVPYGGDGLQCLNVFGNGDNDWDEDETKLWEEKYFGMLVETCSEQYDEKALDVGTRQELSSSPSNTCAVLY